MRPSTDTDALLAEARKAREFSHSPYSGFSVGAAVLTADGQVFSGCNVENASYGLTVCAERVAVLKAVSNGARQIVTVAVPTQPSSKKSVSPYPCGACLQVLSEFSKPDTKIIIDGYGIMHLSELVPHPFQLLPQAQQD